MSVTRDRDKQKRSSSREVPATRKTTTRTGKSTTDEKAVKQRSSLLTTTAAAAMAAATTSSRDRSKAERMSTLEKAYSRKPDVDRKEKPGKQGPTKPKRDSKTELMYLKDVLSKKAASKREEDEVRPSMDRLTVPDPDSTDKKLKNKRDRTRTRTLSPTEIRQLLPGKMASGDYGPVDILGSPESPKPEDTGQDYEDDFEDYESDFEEDDEHENDDDSESPEPVVDVATPSPDRHTPEQPEIATELNREEEKVVSRWETPVSSASRPPGLRNREMEEVRKSIERENAEMMERRKSVTTSLDLMEDREQTNSGKGIQGGAIDFSLASKRQKKEKEVAAARKRGEELLNMISLDAVTYTILEIPPIPYEVYMKTFGRWNTKQVYVQTNEDDLEEEVQTDEIVTCNKWTQNPPEYLGRKSEAGGISYVLTPEERLGVGGDNQAEDEDDGREMLLQSSRTSNLLNFLSWSSQVVLAALERKSGNFLNLENLPHRSKGMAFGDGYLRLNIAGTSCLTDRSVSHLCPLGRTQACDRIVTVHVHKNRHFQRSLLCVWSLRELSKPLNVLVASNRVTSCCFGPNQGNLVFAGLTDGSICLWDLREPSIYHKSSTDESEWTIRSPTYTTAGNLDEVNRLQPIVSLQLLSNMDDATIFRDFTPVQMDRVQRSEPSDDPCLAHWGRVRLLKSSSFSIFQDLRDEMPGLYITCNDLLINDAEDDGFYITNSFGSVHHCSPYGSLMKPKYFVPSKQNTIIETTCLELCPFNGNYFLVGCGDGSVRLHSRHQDKPLITLNFNAVDGEREAPVVSLIWMQRRPCVFFVLDSRSRIHIWDLAVSDMYPETSLILTERKITCMKLLPVSDLKQVPFIAVATDNGTVELHRLKKEYGSRSASDIRHEMKMFLKYVSIL